jgi:LSD1 subclass zinc finger protein
MSTVGTLVFCSDCGNLLDSVAGTDRLECEMCGTVTKGLLPLIRFLPHQALIKVLQTPVTRQLQLSLHFLHSRQRSG